MKWRHMIFTILALSITFVSFDTAVAQDDKPTKAQIRKELAELKQSMKKRFKSLEKLRDDGKVGETYEGEAALVKSSYGKEKIDPKDDESPTIAEVVAAENKDRNRVNELVAIQLKTSKKNVALRDGKRRFEDAEKKHYLKPKGRDWITKEALDKEEKEKESS